MSAWCLLPVLLLLHQVAGHSLPVPQEHDGGGQDGGGQNGGGQAMEKYNNYVTRTKDGGGKVGGGQVEVGQDGGDQDDGGQNGGDQAMEKYNNYVTRTKITQVNSKLSIIV